MSSFKKPRFRNRYIVDISGLPELHIVAPDFALAEFKAMQYISSLETRESHAILAITRVIPDILV